MTTTPQNTKYHNADEDGWCQNTGCDWNEWNSISRPDCPVNFGGKKALTTREQEDMLAALTGGNAPQNTSNDINLCKSCYCMTHDCADHPGYCGKCGAKRDASNSRSGLNIDGLLLAAYYRGKDGRGYSEFELRKDVTAINSLYIKRSDVVEAVGPDEEHPAYCATHRPNVGWCTCHRNRRNALRQEILTKLGLSGEQEEE